MPEVSVVADDLTGALDTGVKFAGEGRQVSVLWEMGATAGDVLVLDTETRCIPPGPAARAAETWAPLAHGLIYKKMDSTLRGPFAAEAGALACAKGLKGVLYAPAFPGSRRTVTRGRLLVDGVPVAETQFARDPACPVRESDIAAVVWAQTGDRPGHLSLRLVRAGPEAVATALDSSAGSVVADAETDADLVTLARALRLRREWLPAGSAGLAGALAAEFGYVPRTAAPECLPRGFVLVCGSAHPANRRQMDRLAEVVDVTPVVVCAGVPDGLPSAIAQDYERTGLALLTTPPERLDDAAPALERALAEVVRQTVLSLDARGLFVTGGQTLLAVLRALETSRLHLEAELAPGVVLSVAELSDGRRLQVVSKAGGFGDDNTLLRLFAAGSAQAD